MLFDELLLDQRIGTLSKLVIFENFQKLFQCQKFEFLARLRECCQQSVYKLTTRAQSKTHELDGQLIDCEIALALDIPRFEDVPRHVDIVHSAQ